MGLRFRKSISLGKFFRLNLSKSGVSLGVGPRGLNVNIGPRGMRETVGIPGTGLFYQESKQWPKSAESSSLQQSVSENNAPESGNIGKLLGFMFIAVILVVVIAGGNSPTNPPKATESIPAAAPQSPAATAKPDRPLTRDEVRELQTLLNKQGFNAGNVDGIVGAHTIAAAQNFARAHHLNGQMTPGLRLLEAARDYRKQATPHPG